MNAYSKYIVIVIITVLLALGGTVIYYFTGYYEKIVEEKTFYVAAPDGTEITETYSFDMLDYETYEFTVRGDVSFQILPNVSEEDFSFEFKHNGKRKQFFAEMNLIKAFNVIRKGDVLEFSMKDDCHSLRQVLQKIYSGETIEMPYEFVRTEERIFTLVIKENGSILYRTIYFGIIESIESFTLSIDKLTF